MKLSQVKLVVSDMDGTLLNNQGQVSQDFFNLFEDFLAGIIAMHFIITYLNLHIYIFQKI